MGKQRKTPHLHTRRGESMDLVTAKISTKEFKAKITPMIKVLEDFSIIFDKKGLSVDEMDASQIALIATSICKAEFDEYKYKSKKKKIVVSIEGELLKKVLSLVYTDDLTLKVVETKVVDEVRTLTKTELVFGFGEGNAWCVVTPREERKWKIPLIKYTAKATANTQELFSLLYKLDKLGEHIRIVLTGEDRYLEVDNKDDFKVRMPFTQVGQVDEIKGEGGNSQFSIMHLLMPFTEDMRKTTPLTTLHLALNAPIMLEFQVGKGVIEYWLAPRIENE